MTSSYLNLAVSLLVPLSAGYAFLVCLCQNQTLTFPLKIALAYGLGMGFLTFWMLLLGMSGQTFNATSIGTPLLIASCIFLFWHWIRKKNPKSMQTHEATHQSQKNHSKVHVWHVLLWILMIVYITQNIFHVFWHSLTIPVHSWDAVATIAFKAKIFYYEQSLPDPNLLPHPTYPHFVPFAESWIAFNLGHWDDILIKIIFPCALLSYVTIHYKFLAHCTNRTWALLGCTILLSSNSFVYHATISYNDFFLMYFNCTTIMLLLLWNQSKESPYLILASLFAGFATFTKLEGTAFLIIYFFLFVIINFSSKTLSRKDKLRNTLKFSLPILAIALTFHTYKIWNKAIQDGPGILDKTRFDFTWEKIGLIPNILNTFFQNLFFSGNWNIVWFLLLISLIRLPARWKSVEVRLTLLSLLLFFGLYCSIGFLTVNYAWIGGNASPNVLPRLILHFYPLSALLIILLNYSAFSRE